MRRIYVASRVSDAPRARAFARTCRALGHQTTSSWHERDVPPDAIHAIESSRGARRDTALRNWSDLRSANTIALLFHDTCKGALCEAAVAYQLGHDVLIVGDPFRATLMLDLPGVRWFATEEAALAYLDSCSPVLHTFQRLTEGR